jgi:ADP-dependent NAD(P)H-hydrate dehydratase / NAD(P)H-hydrate epimerase
LNPAITPLFTTAELRAVEQAALSALPQGALMERAGRAAADLALILLRRADKPRVLVLAGPGNNGGDALVAAALLAETGARVEVMELCPAPASRPPDAQRAHSQCAGSAVRFIPAAASALGEDDAWDLVIDGIFGIGLTRALDEQVCAIVAAANALPCPLLALDVPSGLDADTGEPIGGRRVVQATHTITFIGDKPGLHTAHGRDHAGEVTVASLDVDAALYPPASLHLSGIGAFRLALRRRAHASHKGTYGDVVVLGGAAGMSGAPILAARAAACCGAGRVYAALLDHVTSYDALHPELMLREAAELEIGKGVIVAGPGLGRSTESRSLLERVLDSPAPIVLDADALNLVAADLALQPVLARRRAGTLITPHPLEAARLLGVSASAVQSNRIEAARELARRYCCVALLKGSGSVIAQTDGHAMINPTGNAALATAGSGDVLAGICGALLAQSFSPWQAALAAAWLHGAAADALVDEGTGPIGLSAGELIPAVRALLNQITAQFTPRYSIR